MASTLMKFVLAPYELQFEYGGSYPADRAFRIFQVSDRLASGALRVETLGINTKARKITFVDMEEADYLGLIDWFVNIVNGAEKTFAFTDEYGESGNVKIIDDIILFPETGYKLYSGSINLEYI